MSLRSGALLAAVLLVPALAGCLSDPLDIIRPDVTFTLEADRGSIPMGSPVTFYFNATNNGLTRIYLVGGGCGDFHLSLGAAVNGIEFSHEPPRPCTMNVEYIPLGPGATLSETVTWDGRLYRSRELDTLGEPAPPGTYAFSGAATFVAFNPEDVLREMPGTVAHEQGLLVNVTTAEGPLPEEPLRLRYDMIADLPQVPLGGNVTFRVSITNEGNLTAWFDAEACRTGSYERSVRMQGPSGPVQHERDLWSCPPGRDRPLAPVPGGETRSWTYTWNLTHHPHDGASGPVAPGNYTFHVGETFFTDGPGRMSGALHRRFEAHATVIVAAS